MSDLSSILQTLNTVAALLRWLDSRGVLHDAAVMLLDRAKQDGNRDLTGSEIREVLAMLSIELDETERLINREP